MTPSEALDWLGRSDDYDPNKYTECIAVLRAALAEREEAISLLRRRYSEYGWGNKVHTLLAKIDAPKEIRP